MLGLPPEGPDGREQGKDATMHRSPVQTRTAWPAVVMQRRSAAGGDRMPREVLAAEDLPDLDQAARDETGPLPVTREGLLERLSRRLLGRIVDHPERVEPEAFSTLGADQQLGGAECRDHQACSDRELGNLRVNPIVRLQQPARAAAQAKRQQQRWQASHEHSALGVGGAKAKH